MTRLKHGTPIVARITLLYSQHLRGKVTAGDEGKVITYIYGIGYLCKFAHGSAILSRGDFRVVSSAAPKS